MEEDIRKLLEKNYALSKETYRMVKNIRSYTRWQRFWGWVKFIIIVLPIILAIVYLPAILKDLTQKYQELLRGGNASAIQNIINGENGIDTKNLSPEIQKYLK
ncbi:MAG: hypothetical protein PHU73_04295 [Patescibacteria group bacterium]|nr:hypothetical protein [Patescibacteria group bacterium]